MAKFLKTFEKLLLVFNFTNLLSLVHNLIYSWRYLDNLSVMFFKLVNVFKIFAFIHLLDVSSVCVCNIAKKFKWFLDLCTKDETTNFIQVGI